MCFVSNRVSYSEVLGTKYQKGVVVLVTFDGDIPIFGKLQDILVTKTTVEEYDTSHPHSSSGEIQPPRQSSSLPASQAFTIMMRSQDQVQWLTSRVPAL